MADDRDGKVRARMRSIAEALNLPPDHFFTESESRGSAAEASECLRLWARLATPQGRRRALEMLRVLGDEEAS